MSRRRKHEEHENHERWLVSYADFITLLFAFFVVMYAVSSINEGKYRVLSDAMVSVFRSSSRSLEPIQVGQLVRSPRLQQELPINAPQPIAVPVQSAPGLDGKGREGEGGEGAGGRSRGGDGQDGNGQDGDSRYGDGQGVGALPADREAVAQWIEAALGDLIGRGLVDVRIAEQGVEVEIKTSLLFPSGSAKLVDTALPVLRDLSAVLRTFPNPIRVEGFTDNVPISTEVFPSNWELSAARAASVVHVYTGNGVRPERMVAVGYGEYRPVADNGTPEGRSRNRRVVVVITADPRPRQQVNDASDALGPPLLYSPVPGWSGERLPLRPGSR